MQPGRWIGHKHPLTTTESWCVGARNENGTREHDESQFSVPETECVVAPMPAVASVGDTVYGQDDEDVCMDMFGCVYLSYCSPYDHYSLLTVDSNGGTCHVCETGGQNAHNRDYPEPDKLLLLMYASFSITS